jgi:hypothetical protein
VSTKAERAARAARRIRPIEVTVRQKDGTVTVQWIEADMRQRKHSSRPPPGGGKRKGE